MYTTPNSAEALCRIETAPTTTNDSGSSPAGPSSDTLASTAPWFAALYDRGSASSVLRTMIVDHFANRIALVSSFGTESIVLLHLVGQIDRATPVLFLNTGKLFDETIRYRERLVDWLGLSDVREIQPDAVGLARRDHDGSLWRHDPDRCCALRKFQPLSRALAPFSAWITGRKRMHGGERRALPLVEAADGRIKVNPLARWTRSDIDAYITKYALDRHPLEAEGYSSVGCAPCTDRTCLGEDGRAGRWRGSAKTECGIHSPTNVSNGIRDE